MAAVYIDRDYLEEALGVAVVESMYSEDADVGAEDDARIDADILRASAMVQSYCTAVGYTVGDTTTNELVKLCTLGAIMHMAFARPEKRVPLPESWTDHPARRAYTELLNGTLPLPGVALDSGSAHGGWQFSQPSATNLDSPSTRRTSRRNLSSF